MDKPLTPGNQDIFIEDALRTYPLAPMPRDLTADVMARIQTAPASRPFRLTWNDIVPGIILFLCVGALWFSFDHLPPLVVAQIRKETILFYQHLLVNARSLLPTLFFGIAACLAASTIPYLRRELLKNSA